MVYTHRRIAYALSISYHRTAPDYHDWRIEGTLTLLRLISVYDFVNTVY